MKENTIAIIDNILINFGIDLKFLFTSLYDFIKKAYFDLMILVWKSLRDDFIQFTNCFTQFGIKMIFNTIIRST